DPLWAVGDWRPDEVRVVTADPQTRIACAMGNERIRCANSKTRSACFWKSAARFSWNSRCA
ncbi:hypothetical protein AB0B06_36705, partial [Streptomyces sp. NPDC044989]|uniref:hypothetical protein n=1 Tax=Streptomyces sp. NPDC044989 TaxID=3154336 RepID=UPI0033F40357